MAKMFRMSKKQYFDLQGRNSSVNSKLERNPKHEIKTKNAIKKADKADHQESYCIKFICHRPRRIDLSNLCIKWVEDMIVEAGIIPNDSYKFVKKIELEQVLSKTPKTIVEVYRLK